MLLVSIQYLSRHCTIAKQLNCHKSTISREIKRHRTQERQYSAEKAQRQSRLTKQRKRKHYKLHSQLTQYIDQKTRIGDWETDTIVVKD